MNSHMDQEAAMKMSNEQAIQILKPLRDMMIDQNGCPISEAVFALDKALEALSAQPDIIACGDCKHWICHDRRCGYWNHGVKPLDWCCHAERRTDD